MALVHNQDWLKLAGREEAGKDVKAKKLWRVGKSDKVDFKTRMKLIARERKCFTRMWRRDLMTVVEWCLSGGKDLRFIGREFYKWGDELRNERSAW